MKTQRKGTDGEEALIKAFGHEFGFSQHLTCFIHVRRNIKDKLNECHISANVAKVVLDDIFGQHLGATFNEGLVDSSDSDDFRCKLESLLSKWHNLETTSSADMTAFLQWFKTNKVEVICDTMLHPIREECGLGNPPDIFTTNPSESVNALLKHKVDYNKSELPIFIQKLKEMVAEQNREVERAVIRRGKYRFRTSYKFLEIEESKWFKMTAQQRTKHLSKVHSLSVTDEEVSTQELAPMMPSVNPSSLSIDAQAALKNVNVPLTSLEAIWKKAEELLNDPKAIVAAPGQSEEARIVLSYSGRPPHLVSPQKGGGFICDSNCPNFKSISFCSHTIAVAEISGKLSQFLAFLQKKKRQPNLTRLVTCSMPRGRGRKGNAPPRRRKSAGETTIRVPMTVPSVDQQSTPLSERQSNSSGLQVSPQPAGSSMYMQPQPGWGIQQAYFPCSPYWWNSPPSDPNPFVLCFVKRQIAAFVPLHFLKCTTIVSDCMKVPSTIRNKPAKSGDQ